MAFWRDQVNHKIKIFWKFKEVKVILRKNTVRVELTRKSSRGVFRPIAPEKERRSND